MRRLLERIRQASSDELRFRLIESAATATESLRARRGTSWKVSDLRYRLDPDSSPSLQNGIDALARDDYAGAQRLVREHFLARSSRFPLAPGARREIQQAILANWHSAADEASFAADDLLAGRFDLLGYHGLTFAEDPGDPDWHLDPVHQRRAPLRFWRSVPYLDPQVGDHKIIWELNRHQHWLRLGRAAWLTGDVRYGRLVSAQLRSWMRRNPPLIGINWASMLELAFRTISWVWALHFFVPFAELDEEPWTLDLLLGLDAQANHIERHLSVYFSPNTHLLGEGLALYVIGRALPELKNAARWEGIGRGVLLRESERQVHPDGGHAEGSLHYHRYALDFYLLALAVARASQDSSATRFAETASRMARFCRTVADDRGVLASIGDDDGGMLFPIRSVPVSDARPSLAVAAALLDRPDFAIGTLSEEAIWMGGASVQRPPATPTPHPGSAAFADTGYVALRGDRIHAIFDVGPHGFLNGGHAHSDALALTLTIDGQPLLVDPGTATYTMDPSIRDRFRSTAMHNTVTLFDRSQSLPRGPFHWDTRVDSHLRLWLQGDGVDCAIGEHDGYGPVRHQRAVVRLEDLLVIVDHLLGSGSAPTATHWHLDPEWRIADEPSTMVLHHPGGSRAAIASTAGRLTVARGVENGVGWMSPVYGSIVPGATLLSASEAALPASTATVVGIGESAQGLHLESLPVDVADETASAVAVDLVTAASRRIIVSRALDSSPGPVCSISIGEGVLRTDAPFVCLDLSPEGEPTRLLRIGGGQLSWSGPAPISIAEHVAGVLQLDRPVLRQLSRIHAPDR